MMSAFYRVAHFLLAWLSRLIFLIIPCGQKNEPHPADGPYLICSNHISALDPIYICASVRHQQPHFMAKSELFRIPVLNYIIRKLGAYPVERGRADAGVIKHTVQMIENGKSVAIFPQGTRRPGVEPADTPIRYGAGLIAGHSHVTVLPVFIKARKRKIAFLRPVHVIIGKPIGYGEYTENGKNSGDSAAITKYIFARICELESKQVNRNS